MLTDTTKCEKGTVHCSTNHDAGRPLWVDADLDDVRALYEDELRRQANGRGI